MRPRWILSFVLLFISTTAYGDYNIRWHTIDGGGGTSKCGQYIVRGTIAQHDAAISAGGNYELLGGFWPGEPSCFVDFRHFAGFAEYWLQSGAELPADLNGDGLVDSYDIEMFVFSWLRVCPYDWPLKPPIRRARALCIVDFQDFARFADYWLLIGDDLPADLYKDDIVDYLDLDVFVYEWLCLCPYNWPLK